jgi:hypothetical protein
VLNSFEIIKLFDIPAHLKAPSTKNLFDSVNGAKLLEKHQPSSATFYLFKQD